MAGRLCKACLSRRLDVGGGRAAIGVKDCFGESGAPWELVKEFEVSAEHIAQKAMELIVVKKQGAVGASLVHA